jgi:tetratricopeptide (TPR) repeat protein
MEITNTEQLATEGQVAYDRADYLSAAQLFKAAADGYNFSEQPLLAAEMANNCSVAYLKSGNPEMALEVVIGTEQLFADKDDKLRQAMALGNQAAALEALNRLDHALTAYQQSAELLASLGESELRAYVMQAMSAIQLRRGQYLDAYATMGMGVMGIDKPNLSQKILKSLMQLPFKFIR